MIPLKQYLTSVVALGGGFAVLLLAQYGRLIEFFMNDTLRTVIAINCVSLMATVGIVLASYVVVGQATQAG